MVLAAVLLHQLDPEQARQILEEVEAETDTITGVLDLLAGAAPERDLNRRLFEDTLSLLNPQRPPQFHTRTAQRLAEEG